MFAFFVFALFTNLSLLYYFFKRVTLFWFITKHKHVNGCFGSETQFLLAFSYFFSYLMKAIVIAWFAHFQRWIPKCSTCLFTVFFSRISSLISSSDFVSYFTFFFFDKALNLLHLTLVLRLGLVVTWNRINFRYEINHCFVFFWVQSPIPGFCWSWKSFLYLSHCLTLPLKRGKYY